MKVLSVVGARPNFMKIAPLVREMNRRPGIRQTLVHTGQHFDADLSDVFFRDLGIPDPDINLAIGGGTRDEQIERISSAFAPVLDARRPDVVIVVGDVNSTIACGRVAHRSATKLAHVEAGLRSFDLGMPEEVNRIETDRISDYLFVTERSGVDNLTNERVKGQIHLVGNVMIDSLVRTLPAARSSSILQQLGVAPRQYMVATFHRPSNVDSPIDLRALVETITRICEHVALVLPLHPRTRKSLVSHGLLEPLRGVRNLVLAEPLGYVDFLCVLANAKAAITDSGGIQEETTYLGVPCLTMRANTERPVTLTCGTNTLIGSDYAKLLQEIGRVLDDRYPRGAVPPLWDGNAARRIIDVLQTELSGGDAAARANPVTSNVLGTVTVR